jgi:hypothetical protein
MTWTPTIADPGVWADDVDSVGGISFDDMTSHLAI